MSDEQVAEILFKMEEDGIAATTFPFNAPAIFRIVGWAIIKFLASIVDALYAGLSKVCNALSFAKSGSPLFDLVDKYSGFLYALLILAVLGLGFYLITKKEGNQLSTVQNIVICVLIVSAMPLFSTKMANLTAGAVDDILDSGYGTTEGTGNYKNATNSGSSNKSWSKKSSTGISSVVIANNIVDMRQVDKDTSSSSAVWRYKPNGNSSYEPRGYIDGKLILGGNWKNIDINSTMDYGFFDDLKNEKIWESKLQEPSLGADSELADMGGLFSWDDYYYRWQILSWFNIFGMFIIMSIVLFFTCIKCARLIFEVAMANVYAPFIAATDLATGQRTKEVLKNFVCLFAALFLCIALLGVYFVGFGWIEGRDFGAGISGSFIKIIMHLALAWAIIDGPNVIERIIGIDVGLKSGWQMMMGLSAASSMASRAGRTAAGVGKTAASAGKAAGSAAGKMVFGQDGPSKAKDSVSEGMKTAQSKMAGLNSKVGDKVHGNKAEGAYNAANAAAGKAGDMAKAAKSGAETLKSGGLYGAATAGGEKLHDAMNRDGHNLPGAGPESKGSGNLDMGRSNVGTDPTSVSDSIDRGGFNNAGADVSGSGSDAVSPGRDEHDDVVGGYVKRDNLRQGPTAPKVIDQKTVRSTTTTTSKGSTPTPRQTGEKVRTTPVKSRTPKPRKGKK